MAKPNRLKEIEKEKGDLHKIIPKLVNEHGQYEAGRLIGVSGATIHNWLKDEGYVRIVRYERTPEMERAS
jgi:hypothetical protein